MTADSNRRDGSQVRDHLAEIEELKRRGPSAIPELIERLIEPSWTVRRAAIAALAEANPSAVPEPLSLSTSRPWATDCIQVPESEIPWPIA